MDNYEAKYEFSSHSENFHKFNKYYLNSDIALFYILILALLI